jgi:hypothetical protein
LGLKSPPYPRGSFCLKRSIFRIFSIDLLMVVNVHLAPTDGEPLEDPTHYHHIVGSLVYLGVTRSSSALTQIYYSHLLHVLRYLCGTISHRLFFSHSSSLQLQAYCDATWTSNHSDRRSLSAYFVFLGGSLIV